MPVIETSFEVPAGTEEVWNHLLDVEKVVPCMPGAELTETIDDSHWKGKMKLKVGPVTLTYAGNVSVEERDEAKHRVVMKASAMEQRGKGAANATVTSAMEPFEGGTRVHVTQDINVSGQAAQFSRGMIQDVATRIVHQFADCLRDDIGAGAPAGPSTDASAPAGAPPQAPAGERLPQTSAGGAAEAQPPPEPAPSAPRASRPAELDAGGLVAGAAVRSLLRMLARVLAGLGRAFDAAAKALERAASD